MTKFRKDWAKIVDLLIKAHLSMCPIFLEQTLCPKLDFKNVLFIYIHKTGSSFEIGLMTKILQKIFWYVCLDFADGTCRTFTDGPGHRYGIGREFRRLVKNEVRWKVICLFLEILKGKACFSTESAAKLSSQKDDETH